MTFSIIRDLHTTDTVPDAEKFVEFQTGYGYLENRGESESILHRMIFFDGVPIYVCRDGETWERIRIDQQAKGT